MYLCDTVIVMYMALCVSMCYSDCDVHDTVCLCVTVIVMYMALCVSMCYSDCDVHDTVCVYVSQ